MVALRKFLFPLRVDYGSSLGHTRLPESYRSRISALGHKQTVSESIESVAKP